MTGCTLHPNKNEKEEILQNILKEIRDEAKLEEAAKKNLRKPVEE